MASMVARFRDESADGYVLGPVRAVIGALLLWHALLGAEDLARLGYFGSVYHVPFLPDALVPSPRVYALVLAARVMLSAAVTIGIWARPGLAVSALLGTWVLLCDRNQFHHNRYSLYCYAFLLALAPCDRSWRAIEPNVPEPRRGPYWAARLAGIQVSLVYLASGGSKLLDPDWRDGLVLADRIARHAPIAIAQGAPRAVVEWLARGDVASGLARLAIMTELVVCVAIWIRPVRALGLWWAIWFHLVIQLTSKVETFTVMQLALLGLFVTPDFRARKVRFDPSRFWGRTTGIFVPVLDWFARFEVKPWEPDGRSGHSVVVVRRDGETVTGIRALAMIARCIPLLFPLWAPIALLASFSKQGDLTSGD